MSESPVGGPQDPCGHTQLCLTAHTSGLKEESDCQPQDSGAEGSGREGAGWAAGLWGSEFWEPFPQLDTRPQRTQGDAQGTPPPPPQLAVKAAGEGPIHQTSKKHASLAGASARAWGAWKARANWLLSHYMPGLLGAQNILMTSINEMAVVGGRISNKPWVQIQGSQQLPPLCREPHLPVRPPRLTVGAAAGPTTALAPGTELRAAGLSEHSNKAHSTP